MKKLDFEKFWEVWPKKVDKAEAKKLWAKLSLEQQQQCIMAVTRKLVSDAAWKEKKFIPSPARFLRREKWEDEDQQDQSLDETQRDDGTTWARFWNMLVQMYGRKFEREYGPVMPVLWRQGLDKLSNQEAAKILAMLASEDFQRLPDLPHIRRLRRYARNQIAGHQRELPPPPRNEKLALESLAECQRILRRGLAHQ